MGVKRSIHTKRIIDLVSAYTNRHVVDHGLCSRHLLKLSNILEVAENIPTLSQPVAFKCAHVYNNHKLLKTHRVTNLAYSSGLNIKVLHE